MAEPTEAQIEKFSGWIEAAQRGDLPRMRDMVFMGHNGMLAMVCVGEDDEPKIACLMTAGEVLGLIRQLMDALGDPPS